MMKVMVPIDFCPCSNVALVQALAVARRESAQLHVVHVLPSYENDPYTPMESGNWQEFFARQEDQARERLQALLEAFETQDLTIVQHLPLASAVAPAILQLAEQLDPDLIVIGAYGHRGFRRLLFGSTTQEVVRHATCPVMTVREKTRPIIGHAPERVLVPVDLSAPSRRALRVAQSLTEAEAQIDVVHVVELPTAPPIAAGQSGVSVAELIAGAGKAVARFTQETLGDSPPGPEDSRAHVEIHILQGSPAESLADYADESKADLIVIATRGLSGIPHLLLGSVTERLLRLATCPVLTLKAEDGPPEIPNVVAPEAAEASAPDLGSPG